MPVLSNTLLRLVPLGINLASHGHARQVASLPCSRVARFASTAARNRACVNLSVTLLDAGGLIGVLLILLAYADIHFDWFDPKRAPALLMNLIGAGLIRLSMIRAFNLSAFLMEAAWAAMALYGLLNLLMRRKPE
jgi:paired small multidrug resistance pump